MSLGAAGCKWISQDAWCHNIEIVPGGFKCKKYGELKLAPNGKEPFRAKQCGDNAGKKCGAR